ncbi:MAG: hypothetical protein AAB451_02050 [Patescibacteria group bacterium]
MAKEEFLYQEIFEALNKAKVNYLVCGGAAVILFGSPRFTADLDLIVSLDKENLENLYDTLIKLGYVLKNPIKKEEFINKETLQKLAEEKNMKVVSFYNLKDPFEIIDIGVNLPGIAEILKNKKHIIVKNSDIPIISIDNLIKMKKEVARVQDLIDVKNLEEIKNHEKRKT